MSVMGHQEELADAPAGFALFSDLTGPQLRALIETFEGDRLKKRD